jgi:tryptophan synthase alpha chain
VSGGERIAEAFASASANGRRAALMPYLMGGYPDLESSLAIGMAYADAGADLVELGVPFSDPLADGPVIHAAGVAALGAGVRVADVLELGRALSERVPVILMCYSNVIIARGLTRFIDTLADAGISGLIVPDLPYEEAPATLDACDQRGVALVPLVAPTTTDERLARIGERARGFVYTVSVTGTTGERASIDGGLGAVIARTRAATAVPVAVGFGISSPEHAAQAAAAGADGVIVGTRLVRAAVDGADAVRELVASFSGALRDPVVG